MLVVRWEVPGLECRHTALGRRREGVGSRMAAEGSWGRPQEGHNHATIVVGKGGAGVSHKRWPGTPCSDVL